MIIKKANLTNEKQAADYITLMSLYARDPMGGAQDLSDAVKKDLPLAVTQRTFITVFLAYSDDDQPIGLLTAIEGFSTFACKPLLNIHDVIIHPDHRGQGLAGKLLFIAESDAKKRGCCKVTLEVLTGNEAARKAYQSAGFAPYELSPQFGKAEFWEKKL